MISRKRVTKFQNTNQYLDDFESIGISGSPRSVFTGNQPSPDHTALSPLSSFPSSLLPHSFLGALFLSCSLLLSSKNWHPPALSSLIVAPRTKKITVPCLCRTEKKLFLPLSLELIANVCPSLKIHNPTFFTLCGFLLVQIKCKSQGKCHKNS